jgi:hypothetical protein
MECGKKLALVDGWKIKGLSGIYCKEHAESLTAAHGLARPLKRLSEIITTVNVSR